MGAAHSSDLQRARELAGKLAGKRRAQTGERKREATNAQPYVSFDALDGGAAMPSFHPTYPYLEPVALPELSPGEGYGAGPWTRLLEWLSTVSGGGLAFVMNGEGLTVASRGFESEALVDELGTRLMITVEQANRMGLDSTDVRSLSIRFEERWLSGVSVCVGGRPMLTAGVLSHVRLPDPGIETVASALRRQLDLTPT